MNKREDEYMDNIMQAVKTNSNVHKSFISKQQKRIKELRAMKKAQDNGEDVDISSVIESLRQSGIIDSKGNLTKHYR